MSDVQVHDCLLELVELASMKRLRHEVSIHFIGWAELHFDFSFVDSVRDEEVADVQVSGMLARTCPSILFQQHRTLIVLTNNVVFDIKTLCD